MASATDRGMRITIHGEFDWKAAVDHHWPDATVEAMFNAGRGLNARTMERGQVGAWNSEASEGGWLILPELDCSDYDQPAPFQCIAMEHGSTF